MIQISVAVGDVVTDIVTDQILSFDGIETILNRATQSTLVAYNSYVIANDDFEKLIEDERE
jgi:hypothetical protein